MLNWFPTCVELLTTYYRRLQFSGVKLFMNYLMFLLRIAVRSQLFLLEYSIWNTEYSMCCNAPIKYHIVVVILNCILIGLFSINL